MKRVFDISVVGSDKRQTYLSEKLALKGHRVYTYGVENNVSNVNIRKVSSLREIAANGKIIVCPIPLTKDGKNIGFLDLYEDKSLEEFTSYLNYKHILFAGMYPKKVENYCIKNNIEYYDFMEMNTVAILNGIATAEGAIAEAIRRSVINIHKSKCLVLGYGRCGVAIANKLKGIGGEVTIAARKKESLAVAKALGYEGISIDKLQNYISTYDFIFNTIPAIVLDKNTLKNVHDNVTIIDIASSPGGVDYEFSKEAGINATLCLGLPGMYSPKISGEILADVIEEILDEGKW